MQEPRELRLNLIDRRSKVFGTVMGFLAGRIRILWESCGAKL